MFVGNSFDRSTPPLSGKFAHVDLDFGRCRQYRIRLVTCMHARIRSNSIGAPMRLCNSYILNRFAIGGPMQLVRGTDANWNSIRIDWACACFVFSLQNIFFLARGGFFRYCPPPALVRGKLSSHFVHIYSNLTI